MLGDLYLKEFIQKTSSNDPVPGGGSIAALAGALSSALTEMVGHLTIGKKGYEEVEVKMNEVINICSKMKNDFIEDIDKDANSFDEVMKGFKMPKDTDEEKAKRTAVIQEGYKTAALVPFNVAKNSYEVLKLSEIVIQSGNSNAITDGLVAAMMARTAVLGALYNVKINIGSIKDLDFVENMKKEIEILENKTITLEKKIMENANI